MKSSGYKQNIKFQRNVFIEAQKRKSNRGRKIIWFNPRYSSVATGIGKKFFLLLDKISLSRTNSIRFSTRTMLKSVAVQCQIFPTK